ncbi:ATP-binding protein [uncultured Desulfobacter sp.]|uniref:ATP-binding protein n=1 Tax=uncultured Desulfobacter sp. TaxID=240139 RepID=UPI002AAAF74F|nr:ATP-binding protein [uncultured Desulfobacter sp.]
MMSQSLDLYEIKEEKDHVFIRFSSTMDHIDDACAAVLLFLRSRGSKFFPYLFAVNLGMREAMANAVRHGNKYDQSKLVTMELDISRDPWLCMKISDQGPGFEWTQVQDRVAPDEADHGRGMSIMRTYFDRFTYNDKGNILYLEKRIL